MSKPKDIGRLVEAKHGTVMKELVMALPSPTLLPLIDALLEEKRLQYQDVLEIKNAQVEIIKAKDRINRAISRRAR